MHPGLVPAPLSCTICNKTFIRRASLNIHLTSHSTATPHGCDQCDKQYKTPQGLRDHRATKHGVGPTWAPRNRVERSRVL